ncbi:MAG: aspartate aminotransferase family protein [Planctomycetaceae bacterium]|jgi:predicted acetylornithine/succinylornithine family transaminase|nr:aspartate aminotransferase family protein [Planctomycetaceae bacterium]
MLSSQEIISTYNKYVIGNYTRYPVAIVRGEKAEVWDAEGRRYIDFFPGWGCGLLGHCPQPIVEAVQKQVARLIHVPNTWYTEQQGEWAKKLSERSFGGQAFFCNSGAEANEAAIKLVRLHSPKGKYKIITFQGSFHGRTMGAVSATAQPKYHTGLEPLLAGFTYVPYGDINAVQNAIDDETAAIMIEPIQGEGGVRTPPEGFLQTLRQLCDSHKLLLIFDEVQTGCGRTGNWFAYQYYNVEPDIMTLAKAVAGGLAGAAMLARREVAPSLRPGMHASTYGGNPIAAAAGIATIDMIEKENLLQNATKIGELFISTLKEFKNETDLIQEIRGCGVMIGIELAAEGTQYVKACMDNGLLINCTHNNVLRLLPPMNLDEKTATEGLEILIDALRK